MTYDVTVNTKLSITSATLLKMCNGLSASDYLHGAIINHTKAISLAFLLQLSINVLKKRLCKLVARVDLSYEKSYSELIGSKKIIFRYFLARYRNFLPQVDQKVHQVLQNLPQAFCIGDVIRYDSIKPKKYYKI